MKTLMSLIATGLLMIGTLVLATLAIVKLERTVMNYVRHVNQIEQDIGSADGHRS